LSTPEPSRIWPYQRMYADTACTRICQACHDYFLNTALHHLSPSTGASVLTTAPHQEKIMNQTSIVPYLFFGGHCEDALNFYKDAVGAKIEMILRFSDSPEPPPPGAVPANYDNKIMHASFRIGSSQVMASDGCGEQSTMNGF